MDFKIFAAELYRIFPKASLEQTFDLHSALGLNSYHKLDPIAVARDDAVIREFMASKRKIQAIKELRSKLGLGLLDAKVAVDAAYHVEDPYNTL